MKKNLLKDSKYSSRKRMKKRVLPKLMVTRRRQNKKKMIDFQRRKLLIST
jgi:hypothetical protein